MARIRTIKPEFWSDGKIIECSTNARLLFIGTWNFADDFGNLDRSSKQIKAQVFPADSFDCEPLVLELITRELLVEYSTEGKHYLHIQSFAKHQKVDRPGAPRCPPFDTSSIIHRTFDESSTSIRDGREGKGREKEGKGGKPSPATGAKPPDPVKDEIWKTGRELLNGATSKSDAGSFLGKLCRDFGTILVLESIRDADRERPAEPKAWLTARCQERRAKSGNKQLSLEEGNRQAVKDAMRMHGNG